MIHLMRSPVALRAALQPVEALQLALGEREAPQLPQLVEPHDALQRMHLQRELHAVWIVCDDVHVWERVHEELERRDPCALPPVLGHGQGASAQLFIAQAARRPV